MAKSRVVRIALCEKQDTKEWTTCSIITEGSSTIVEYEDVSHPITEGYKTAKEVINWVFGTDPRFLIFYVRDYSITESEKIMKLIDEHNKDLGIEVSCATDEDERLPVILPSMRKDFDKK